MSIHGIARKPVIGQWTGNRCWTYNPAMLLLDLESRGIVTDSDMEQPQ